MRGNELDEICVWDFISRVNRVSKSSDRRKHRSASENAENVDMEPKGMFDDVAEDFEDESDEEFILDSDAFKRPRVPLLKGHDQESTHILRVRSPGDTLIPVPIGPAIPRRDRTDVYARYCRLMLIFFKPWRHARDLRKNGQSWEDAFNLFARNTSAAVKYKMDNMQILHECRDSRDDHFAERRYLVRRAVKDVRRRGGHEDADDFCGEDGTEKMILDHLEEITDRFSFKKAASQEAILECIDYAEDSGLYNIPNNAAERCIPLEDDSEPHGTHLVTNRNLEDIWEKAYDDRRELSKKNATGETPKVPPSTRIDRDTPLINDGFAFRNAFTSANEIPRISQDVPASDPVQDVDIEAHVRKWTLNREHAHAFRIIAHHSLQNS